MPGIGRRVRDTEAGPPGERRVPRLGLGIGGRRAAPDALLRRDSDEEEAGRECSWVDLCKS